MAQIETLLSTTVAATGAVFQTNDINAFPWSEYLLSVTGTGAVTGSVRIDFSNDIFFVHYFTQTTVALSGTTEVTVNVDVVTRAKYVRCVSTTILGTGATILVTKAT